MGAFNAERAAHALAAAAFYGDGEAAKRHGVSVRSVQRWRTRLDTDPDLAAFVADSKEALTAQWTDELGVALLTGIDFLRRAANEADPTDPKAIRAVTEAFRVLAEASVVERMLEARLNRTGMRQLQPTQYISSQPYPCKVHHEEG